MRRLFIIFILLPIMVLTAHASEITPPTVPEGGEAVFPEDPTSFSDGLEEILRDATVYIRPAIADCMDSCIKILAIVIMASIFQGTTFAAKRSIALASTLSIALLLLTSTDSLINLGTKTITDITHYGKLLLPVMATAMAAQGAPSSSAALFAGTASLNALLSSIVTAVLIPMIYIYLVLGAASNAIDEDLLKKTKAFIKWCLTWILKIVLYVFTGYMSITGVVTGSIDAAAIKATKITLSGVVPVVGGIISDASEVMLVSAGVLKNTAGIYGILALISILIGPFIKIGIQYLALKVTGSLCSIFCVPQCGNIIQDFTTAMGLLLAMTGTVSLLQLISTVCFMRGVGI